MSNQQFGKSSKAAYKQNLANSQDKQNIVIAFLKSTLRKGMDLADKIIAYANQNSPIILSTQCHNQQSKRNQSFEFDKNNKIIQESEKQQFSSSDNIKSKINQKSTIISKQSALHAQKTYKSRIFQENIEELMTQRKKRSQLKTMTVLVPLTDGRLCVDNIFDKVRQKRQRLLQQQKLRVSREQFKRLSQKYEKADKINKDNSLTSFFKKYQQNLQQKESKAFQESSKHNHLSLNQNQSNNISSFSVQKQRTKQKNGVKSNSLQTTKNLDSILEVSKQQSTSSFLQDSIIQKNEKLQNVANKQKINTCQTIGASTEADDKKMIQDGKNIKENNFSLVSSSKDQIPKFNPFLMDLNKTKTQNSQNKKGIEVQSIIQQRKNQLFSDLFKTTYSSKTETNKIQPKPNSLFQPSKNTFAFASNLNNNQFSFNQQKPDNNNPSNSFVSSLSKFSNNNSFSTTDNRKQQSTCLFGNPALQTNTNNKNSLFSTPTNPQKLFSTPSSLFNKNPSSLFQPSVKKINSFEPNSFLSGNQPSSFSYIPQHPNKITNMSDFSNAKNCFTSDNTFNTKDKQILNSFINPSMKNNGMKNDSQSILGLRNNLSFQHQDEQDRRTQRRSKNVYSRDTYDRRRNKKQQRIRG